VEIGKEVVRDLPALIEALEGSYSGTIKTFEVQQPIREVKKFGQSITERGTLHNCRIVSDYGKKLNKSAENFDVEGMLKLIRKYNDILQSLRN
jgi:hypothetical protein